MGPFPQEQVLPSLGRSPAAFAVASDHVLPWLVSPQ
jgi:hypothetical protein